MKEKKDIKKIVPIVSYTVPNIWLNTSYCSVKERKNCDLTGYLLKRLPEKCNIKNNAFVDIKEGQCEKKKEFFSRDKGKCFDVT